MRVCLRMEKSLIMPSPTTQARSWCRICNDVVIGEVFLENPRHVEIQILAGRVKVVHTFGLRPVGGGLGFFHGPNRGGGGGGGFFRFQPPPKKRVGKKKKKGGKGGGGVPQAPPPTLLGGINARSAGQTLARDAGQACVEIGYRSAALFEFLYENGANFYFIEMNTRIQVKQSVSEMITGH